MTVDEVFAAAVGSRAEIPHGWSQGRSTFGGIVGGVMLARAEAAVADPDRLLRSATVSFVAPVHQGPVELDADPLRVGRSGTQVRVTMSQDGSVVAAMLASFGAARASAIAWSDAGAAVAPEYPAPEQVAATRVQPGVTPEFFERIEMRLAAGAHPFTAAADPGLGGWMRFTEPPSVFRMPHLMTLTDCWPPAVMSMFPGPGLASSLTWTFEPVGEPPEAGDDPADHWQYETVTDHCGGGYGHAGARVWDQAGRLRAISRQTIAVFL